MINYFQKLITAVFVGCFMFFGNQFVSAEGPTVGSVLEDVRSTASYKGVAIENMKNGYSAALVGRFIGVFLGIMGVIFTVLFVYAGYLWFSAGGDAAALTKAKEIMMRAVIGLIIVVSAYVITYFVTVTLTQGDYFIQPQPQAQ